MKSRLPPKVTSAVCSTDVLDTDGRVIGERAAALMSRRMLRPCPKPRLCCCLFSSTGAADLPFWQPSTVPRIALPTFRSPSGMNTRWTFPVGVNASDAACWAYRRCMSGRPRCQPPATHLHFKDPFYATDGGYVLGARITENIVDLDALFVEIDVGTKSNGMPHAYQTHEEALAAFDKAAAAAGLPIPSLVINSGSGGAHILWVLDQALPLEQWLDPARRLVTALKAGGLVADWQQTTMPTAAARFPARPTGSPASLGR